jgi:catechol 2,3-dioxygenase-like lactoylglutathione lyase family enzyme
MRFQSAPSPLRSIQNTDYVVLLCADLERAKRFYRDVLEFQLYSDSKEWVRFKVGTTFITLRPRGRWLSWTDGPIPATSAALQLAFQVPLDQVDPCHAELLKKGVEIIDPPRDHAFGHRTLFFRDPDQNVIEIFADL